MTRAARAGRARAFLVAMRRSVLALAIAVYLPAVYAHAEPEPLASARVAAIAAAHPAATAAGHDILAQGGNAFDAAVAVAAVLAVVEPFGSGLGGGGFWLLHRARDRRNVVVDAREVAPLAAHAKLYLDAKGEVRPRASLDGPLAAGIPGTPAALAHIAKRYGKLPLRMSLAPAIKLAQEGFPVGARYVRHAEAREGVFRQFDADPVFLDDGFVPAVGFVLKQPALARTLRALALNGANGFYRGVVAKKLVEGVRAHGGIWTARDLRHYRVIERRPLVVKFRDSRIVTVPPPAGGLVVAEILRLLEPYPLAELPPAERTPLIVGAMRLAYRDRAERLGDPAFTPVPTARLLSDRYIARLRRELPAPLPAATPAAAISDGNTTHFSIIDADGNRVAATHSINGPFGSAFVPAGTGVLLNNEMDDFVAKPGVPNLYGLVGSRANAIAPGKRPLSSMSPTFVETPRGIAVLGTPGGSRIISMVTLATLSAVLNEGTPADWVKRPRFHQQYKPEQVEYEAGALSPEEIAALIEVGYALKELERPYGDMHIVWQDKASGTLQAASDPRGEGAAVGR